MVRSVSIASLVFVNHCEKKHQSRYDFPTRSVRGQQTRFALLRFLFLFFFLRLSILSLVCPLPSRPPLFFLLFPFYEYTNKSESKRWFVPRAERNGESNAPYSRRTMFNVVVRVIDSRWTEDRLDCSDVMQLKSSTDKWYLFLTQLSERNRSSPDRSSKS